MGSEMCIRDSPAPPAAAAEEPPAAPAPPPPPPPPTAPAPEQSSGPYAITQYDYEAAEDNELGFNEGDKIVAIEFASDEWWSGTLERTGDVGLFPAVSEHFSISITLKPLSELR